MITLFLVACNIAAGTLEADELLPVVDQSAPEQYEFHSRSCQTHSTFQKLKWTPSILSPNPLKSKVVIAKFGDGLEALELHGLSSISSTVPNSQHYSLALRLFAQTFGNAVLGIFADNVLLFNQTLEQTPMEDFSFSLPPRSPPVGVTTVTIAIRDCSSTENCGARFLCIDIVPNYSGWHYRIYLLF